MSRRGELARGRVGGRRTRHQMGRAHAASCRSADFPRSADFLRNAALPCDDIPPCEAVPALVLFHSLKIGDAASAAGDDAGERHRIAGTPKRLGRHRAIHSPKRIGRIDDARRRAPFGESGGTHDAHARRNLKALFVGRLRENEPPRIRIVPR